MPYSPRTLPCLAALLLAPGVYAYDIDDAWNGATSYWGHNRSGYADIIGNPAHGGSEFEIQGADLLREVSAGRVWLTVTLYTRFAGRADDKRFSALTVDPRGIGYGDLFLAPQWTPEPSQAHYAADHAGNGTHWTHAFVLADRWDPDGGPGGLYALGPADPSLPDHNPDALRSEDFMKAGTFRKGQAVAASVSGAPVSPGSWTLDDGNFLRFDVDVTGTLLATSEAIALHWGMTCANDVIEGVKALPPPIEISAVPEPGTTTLVGLGLAALARLRRPRTG